MTGTGPALHQRYTDNENDMTAATVLITGAHGFIGRHTARQFARDGRIVIGMGHGRWTSAEWQSWGLSQWHESDVSSSGLQKFAGSPEVIVHCAGSGSVADSLSDPLSDFHRTVTTTASVMDYVHRHSPNSRVIYPSSASVYGVAERIPIDECAPCMPISPYGVHKLIAEQLVASYTRHFSVSAAIVRLFSVYGCGLRKQLLWDGCNKLVANDFVFMGTGDEIRDWLHVDDAAELLRLASHRADTSCPIVNGGVGDGVRVSELLEHLGRCLRRDGRMPVFSEKCRVGDPSIYVADVSKAKQWGWTPSEHWKVRVAEYAAWWKLEMGLQDQE